MRKFFLIIFCSISLFCISATPSNVSAAVSCSGGIGCSGKNVGDQDCSTTGLASVCRPTSFDSEPTNGSVSCLCNQANSSTLQQVDSWLNTYDTAGSTGDDGGTGGSGGFNCNLNCDYEPDFACINRKILNPGDTCCENKCKGSDSGVDDPVLEKYNDYGILGIKVRITESSIPSLINLAITTFLGIIALYALFRGIYVAGVKRTQAISDDELVNVNKELTGIVIGFVLAFLFIFIIQIVFNVLGVSIADLDINFTGESGANTPQLIISGDAD